VPDPPGKGLFELASIHCEVAVFRFHLPEIINRTFLWSVKVSAPPPQAPG